MAKPRDAGAWTHYAPDLVRATLTRNKAKPSRKKVRWRALPLATIFKEDESFMISVTRMEPLCRWGANAFITSAWKNEWRSACSADLCRKSAVRVRNLR